VLCGTSEALSSLHSRLVQNTRPIFAAGNITFDPIRNKP
jgi:hypothetical protein